MTKRGTRGFSHAHTLVRRPRHLALVLLGGMVGTAARWGLTSVGEPLWTTLLVNLAGSFLLGLLLEVLVRREADLVGHVEWRLLLGTGFCGAFTTYSAMALDVATLLRDDARGLGLLVAAATVVGGVGAAGLGVLVGAIAHRGSAGVDA